MWGLRFRLRQYLTESLWFLPLIGGLAGVVLGTLSVFLDRAVDVPSWWQYSESTASTVLSAVVGSTAALTGFVVTVSVLVVQLATGMFSARFMRLWHRDRLLQGLLAVLVGTFTFSFALLRQVEDDFVPHIGTTVAGLLMATGLFLFLFFLDRFVHRLRPVAVASLVARAAREALEEAVAAMAAPDAPEVMPQQFASAEEPAFVARARRAGAIQAIDGPGLVRLARELRSTLVLRHTIGDFVPIGAPLVDVYGGAPDDPAALERRLLGMIALGVERTIEQDPAFAVRIMVDIANKALSAAVNDPTTAVQVLNHLGETLRLIGSTDFDPPRVANDGGPRVLVPIRRWEDYLALGVTEIRRYGASSIQVVRRLRAMLEELHGAVRPEHRAAVEAELARLDATVARVFGDSVDLDRASQADRQGIGGPTQLDRPDVPAGGRP